MRFAVGGLIVVLLIVAGVMYRAGGVLGLEHAVGPLSNAQMLAVARSLVRVGQ